MHWQTTYIPECAGTSASPSLGVSESRSTFTPARRRPSAGLPVGIMPDTAQTSVVITLVDDTMRGNDEWISCVDTLAAKIETAGHSHLFLPVACDDRAHMISAKANEYNFI